MKNFWQKLNKPFFCLAPMADVTDCVFREIVAKYSKPDARPTEEHQPFGRVFYTEFVAADGLTHSEAKERLLIDLKYSEAQRPIVAQIFGGKSENMKAAAKLCVELGFDGIDINMGCPDRKVEKQKAGAYCIKDPIFAREIIRATKEGAGDIPVSVKTRLGYNKVDMEFLRVLLEEGIAALVVHLRTRSEMSKVPAHWELVPEIVALRDKVAPDTLIIGNGDVADIYDARRKCQEYGCDGVMLGRAVFGNPFLFDSSSSNFSTEKKLKVMVEHTKLYEKMLGKHKNFAIMKKHYKAYANGFSGSKGLRIKLMEANSAQEVENIVAEFLKV